MAENVKEFFNRFVEDFPSFDGSVIASRYTAPYTAVSSDGELWHCTDPVEVKAYFQSLLDRHLSNGVLFLKYSDYECQTVGKSKYFATVTWSMMGAEDKVVSTWRESYNLVDTDAGLKIFTSIDH
ncbi:MAG: hypothetical protein ACJASG_000989 [Oleiphilaceae bacterium]|jgi:hypothetical protein